MILLSDGKSQGTVHPAASDLKQSGVILYAVGLRYPRYHMQPGVFVTPNSVFFSFCTTDIMQQAIAIVNRQVAQC